MCQGLWISGTFRLSSSCVAAFPEKALPKREEQTLSVPAVAISAMRSSQALLRLAGGGASALLVLAATLYFFIDLLPQVAAGSFLRALHFTAECALLGGAGVAGVLAEIRPHPMVSENFPYLTKLSGRSLLYTFLGMYVIGRREHSTWGRSFDIFVGFVCLAVATAGMVFARRLSSLPPQLSESLGREMHTASAQPQPTEQMSAS
eukprot:symbB.v1.2.035613.t1/scaffold4840.1/size34004/2